MMLEPSPSSKLKTAVSSDIASGHELAKQTISIRIVRRFVGNGAIECTSLLVVAISKASPLLDDKEGDWSSRGRGCKCPASLLGGLFFG